MADKIMPQPIVSIIIVNFNGIDFLAKCFNSLQSQTLDRNLYEVIVIDNNSTDGSFELIKLKFPSIKCIKTPINNYCRSCNIGIKAARGKYVVFVNNDMTFNPHWLEQLLNTIENSPQAAGVQSKIIYPNGDIFSLGGEHTHDFYFRDISNELPELLHNPLYEPDSLCGASALYHKDILEEIGYLDEDFLMYFEDVDLAYRIKKLGYKLLVNPQSIAIHNKNQFGDAMLPYYLTNRNRFALAAKHSPKDFCKTIINSENLKNEALYFLNRCISFGVYKLLKHHPDIKFDSLLNDISLALKSVFDETQSNQMLNHISQTQNKSNIYKNSIDEELIAFSNKKSILIKSFQSDHSRSSFQHPTQYHVILQSNASDSQTVTLVFDIFPRQNPKHPSRHYAYYAWKITLAPNEKKSLTISYDWDKEAICQKGANRLAIIDAWRGGLKNPEKYEISVYLMDTSRRILDKYFILQSLKI